MSLPTMTNRNKLVDKIIKDIDIPGVFTSSLARAENALLSIDNIERLNTLYLLIHNAIDHAKINQPEE